MKQITIAEIESTIAQAIDSDNENQRIHDIVRNVLARFQGRPITKRIETAVAKAQPGWVVYLNNQYGMSQLYVWGGDTHRDANNRFGMLLGYNTDPIVDIDKFERYDACHGSAALARNAGRVTLLAGKSRLLRLVDAVNKVLVAKAELAVQLSDLSGETWEVTRLIENALK